MLFNRVIRQDVPLIELTPSGRNGMSLTHSIMKCLNNHRAASVKHNLNILTFVKVAIFFFKNVLSSSICKGTVNLAKQPAR